MIFNRLVLQNLYTSGSVSYVWFVEVNNNGASDQSAIGLEFGMKYKAIIPGEEQTTHSYTQGFTLENYQVCISNMWGAYSPENGIWVCAVFKTPPFQNLSVLQDRIFAGNQFFFFEKKKKKIALQSLEQNLGKVHFRIWSNVLWS